MTDRTVAVALIARVQGFVAGIGTATQSAQGFGQELDRLGRESPGKLNDITAAMGGVGLSMVAMAGYAVHAAMAFDKQMSEVGAVANATSAQMEQLRAVALAAGKATAYSATEAASAEAELAKAGMSTKDILGGGLAGALSLAAAGQMDLADAAEITAKAMNMFELRSTAASHIADVFAAAANSTAADMHGLGMGLQQVGLVAHQVGWSFESTTAILGAFADRGLQGSDGATSLKTAIMALSAPTDKAAALMQQLGLKVYDSQGQFLSADALAGQLQQTLGGLSQSERQAAMSTLFGSDAIRAGNVLLQLGQEGVRKYTTGVYQQGAAADMASQKTDNLAGDVERLTGTIETLAISSGSGASGGLRILAKAADGALGAFLDLPPAVSTTVTVIAGIGGAGLLAGAGLLKARQSVMDMMTALRDAGPIGTRAADGLGKVGAVAGKLFLVGAGVAVLSTGIGALSDALEKKTIKRDVDDLVTSLGRFADTGRAAGELAKTFGADLAHLSADIGPAREAAKALAEYSRERKEAGKPMPWDTLGKHFDLKASQDAHDLNKQQREDIEALDKALSTMVNNGNATQAKMALDQMAASGNLTADQYQSLLGLLPKYNAAVTGAGAASTGAARGFADQEQAARTMSRSWQDAIDKGQTLTDLFNELNGAAISSARAEIAVEDGLRGLDSALKESGGSLDVHTEKGAAAKKSLIEMADALGKDLEAMRGEGQGLDQINAKYGEYRDRLIANMVAHGITREAAQKLADTYLAMPKQAVTNVYAPGLDEAQNKAADLARQLWRLDNTVTNADIYIQLHGYDQIERAREAKGALNRNRWGGITEYAASGLLSNASIYPAGSRPLYGFAEPETGGEAFIPRNGDLARSRGIAEHVVGQWLGGSVRWGRGSAGSAGATIVQQSTVISIPVTAPVGADLAATGKQLVAAIRQYLPGAI